MTPVYDTQPHIESWLKQNQIEPNNWAWFVDRFGRIILFSTTCERAIHINYLHEMQSLYDTKRIHLPC